MIRIANLLLVTLLVTLTARADFSYTQTRKQSGGPMASIPGEQPTKHYFKGQKMKIDTGNTATVLDFDAQTITSVNNSNKTYSVMKFSEVGDTLKDANVDATVDVKETGQQKNINGYNASEVVMTIAADSPQMSQSGMKMQMELDMWLSKDVPGSQEMRDFYQRNGTRFPWGALGANANPSMQKAIAAMQQKMARIGGVPVLQVIRMKPSGNGAQMAEMQQGMSQARARLEEMKRQGGPQAAAAEQALARMGGMASSGSGSLFEMTMESSNFSTSSIPDSIFAVPAGYQKTDKK